jgi:hypothetical protein
MKKLMHMAFRGIQQNWNLLVLVSVIALFVLAAGAPSATIGIGK